MFPLAIRELGLKTTRFTSIFDLVSQPSRSGTLPEPGRGRSVTTSTVLPHATDRGSKLAGPTQGTSYQRYRNRLAQSHRLAPVLKDTSGCRVDRLLQVNDGVVKRLKELHLCYYLFLRGECSGNCDRNHQHRALADNEFDALWSLARKGQCYQHQRANREADKDCTDELCIYGHRSGK